MVKNQIKPVFTERSNRYKETGKMKQYIQMVITVVMLAVGMTGCMYPVPYQQQGQWQQPQPQQQPMYGYENSGRQETWKSEDGRKEVVRYINRGTGTAPVLEQYPTYVQQGGGQGWVNPEYYGGGHPGYGDSRSTNGGHRYVWEEHRDRNSNNGSPVHVTPAPDVSGLLP
jgi:hypothetical protein